MNHYPTQFWQYSERDEFSDRELHSIHPPDRIEHSKKIAARLCLSE